MRGRAKRDQLSFANDRNVIGKRFGFVQIVRAQDDGMSAPAQTGNRIAHLLGAVRVHRGGWLVEKEDARVVQHRADQCHFLAHPFGKIAEPPVARVPQLEMLHQFFGPRAAFGLRQVLQFAEKVEIVERAHPQIQTGKFGEMPDEVAHEARLTRHIVAGDPRVTARRFQNRGEHPHGRRLAGAVRAQEREDFALGDGERQIVDGDQRVELFGETSSFD